MTRLDTTLTRVNRGDKKTTQWETKQTDHNAFMTNTTRKRNIGPQTPDEIQGKHLYRPATEPDLNICAPQKTKEQETKPNQKILTHTYISTHTHTYTHTYTHTPTHTHTHKHTDQGEKDRTCWMLRLRPREKRGRQGPLAAQRARQTRSRTQPL